MVKTHNTRGLKEVAKERATVKGTGGGSRPKSKPRRTKGSMGQATGYGTIARAAGLFPGRVRQVCKDTVRPCAATLHAAGQTVPGWCQARLNLHKGSLSGTEGALTRTIVAC